jgi:DNA repair protein RecO
MRLYRDRAVVLRQHKLGEADRIVTLLTRDHGLVRAVAKGVRRTRSKFGARLEPFAHIDVQLHPGRNLDIVTQVVSLDAFATDIVSDYGRYTSACAMLETAERLAGEERAPAPELHRLTVGALRAVADGRRPRELLLDAYLLRAMSSAGWAPALTECARCAAPGPHRALYLLPPRRCDDTSAGCAGSDVSAARRRLGGRGDRAAVGPQPCQRIGGCSPAMASGTAAANVAASRADEACRCDRSEPPRPSYSSGQAGCRPWGRAG